MSDWDIWSGRSYATGPTRPRFSSALDLHPRKPGDERPRPGRPIQHPEDHPRRTAWSATEDKPATPQQQREAFMDDRIARAVAEDERDRQLQADMKAKAEQALEALGANKLAGAQALLAEHRKHCRHYSLKKNAPVRYCPTCRAFEHLTETLEQKA